MTSLRTRLLLWLLGALVLVGVIGGAGLYLRALIEADAVFDEQLQETAMAMRDRSFLAPTPEYGEREAAADFVVQVWSLNGVRMYQSQRHATVPGPTRLGFSTVVTPEGRWRVYGLQTPFNVIQIAQPLRVREQRAAHLAVRILLPLVLMLPILGVIIWLTVGRALRPLRTLASEVEKRPAGDGLPLAVPKLPAEVVPLVTALNDLLGRLAALRERERRFIADAAHELRTPLTALRLQLGGIESASDFERHEAATALGAGVGRAARLVEQMLALARQDAPEAPPYGPVVLADLAREVLAELLPAADVRRIDLGLGEANTAPIEGDAEALRTLLRNLVDNAIRYSPESSRIDVAVHRDDDRLLLSVSDQGPGIPEIDRARVFDRFYRLPGAASGGSGLGLAIVKTIADAHGADVALEAVPGGGLRVVARFPVAT